jgi:cell volume regulation protein A
MPPRRVYPIEYTPVDGLKSELKELRVPEDSNVVGKAIVELGLPAEFLVVLIARGDEFLVPSGGTVLVAGDTLLVLSEKDAFEQVQSQIGVKHEVQSKTGENRGQ